MSAALFVLGVYLSIRLLAALHRARDLWYTIRTAWPRVGAGVVGWGGATVAAALLATGERRGAFLAGLLGYAAFYASLFPLFALAVRARRRARLAREARASRPA